MGNMITRTVVGTKVTAKIVNADTNVVSTRDFIISKVCKDESTAFKQTAKQLGDKEVLIRVESYEATEKLFGLPVVDFMAKAVELDPVTRKPLENATPIAELLDEE